MRFSTILGGVRHELVTLEPPNCSQAQTLSPCRVRWRQTPPRAPKTPPPLGRSKSPKKFLSLRLSLTLR